MKLHTLAITLIAALSTPLFADEKEKPAAKDDAGWIDLLTPKTTKLDDHWTTTGNWTLNSPEPRTDAAVSASLNRAGSDQKQVEKLKELAYTDAADNLLKSYSF